MEQESPSLHSALEVVTTIALAFLGCIVVVFPTAALVDGVVGSPLGADVVGLTAAFGLLGAAVYFHRELSVKRLWRFIGIAVLTGFAWLVVVGAGFNLLGAAIEAGDRRPFLYAWLLALATAYTTTYADVADLPTIETERSPTDDST